MKYGIAFANTMSFASAEGAAQLGRAAEAAGFESLWTVEHVVFPDGYVSEYPYSKSGKMPMGPETDLPDPLVWLTWVAAHTTTLRLGTGIVILPERNPVMLAKVAATVDWMSGGRLELGIGVGWLEEEFDALGVPWERRGARTDDYVAAMRTLWSGDSVNHEGEFVSFSGVTSNPKPAQGSIPIVVGGHSPAAARRAGRLGDGFFPAAGNLAELLDIMRQSAADAGRDPEAIEVTTHPRGDLSVDPVGVAEEMANAGVDRLILPAFNFLADPEASLVAFGEQVIAPTAG